MIDTDKYEGHTPKHWRRKYNFGQIPFNKADENLIYDAPILLQEVKRLRSIIDYIRDTGRMVKPKEVFGLYLSIMEKVLTTKEYIRWHLEWRNEE